MDKYTIYCTEEQTRTALKLGAPIETYKPIVIDSKAGGSFTTPAIETVTAEQMIGWLEEQEDIKEIFVTIEYINWHYAIILSSGRVIECNDSYDSRKEATLAAIDAALDYLIKTKK